MTGFYESYKRATATELHHVYKSYSKRKAIAFDDCKELCRQLNGEDFKVVSACSNFFTVGFIYPDADGLYHFRYETHANSYDEILDEF